MNDAGQPTTVAVLGASGGAGRAITHAVSEAGHRVIAITRRGDTPPRERADAGPIEARRADIADPASLSQALGGSHTVVSAINVP